jgi:hypothetical protein
MLIPLAAAVAKSALNRARSEGDHENSGPPQEQEITEGFLAIAALNAA